MTQIDPRNFIQVNHQNYSMVCGKNGKKITVEIVMGNLIYEKTDSITNAANEVLQLGDGVAGAIKEHGGPSI